MRAIIMAGGNGTRLAPYTTILPKPLMPVGDMPILEIVIRQLKRYGIDRITLSVGTLASLVEAYFGDGSRWGVKIDYSREDRPLGTAGPIGLIDDLDEPFLVMNGDILTTLPYMELVRFHAGHGRIGTIAGCAREVRIDLGVLTTNGNGSLTAYLEKPVYNYLASMGVYVFQPQVLAYIPRGQRLDLPDLVRTLMGLEFGIAMYRFDGYWLDIGRHDDFARAREEFEAMRGDLLPE
jgi:NDP-sugar pyrophosphorylase family protein